MNKEKTPIWVPILWFITTGLWVINLCYDMSNDLSPLPLQLLKALVVLTSLMAAIINWIRYKNGKSQQ